MLATHHRQPAPNQNKSIYAKGLRLCRGVLILRLRLAAVNLILASLRELGIFQHLGSHEATA